MDEKLIVRTEVKEVVGGAISNVTLTVEKAGSSVLSATIAIGETTVGKMQSMNVYTDNEKLIREAFGVIMNELRTHGVDSLNINTVNSDVPAEMICSAM